MSAGSSANAARLHRVSDKLGALEFPYFFDEDAFAASDVEWRPLRDAAVWLEDTHLRLLVPAARQALRAVAFGAFAAALGRYATGELLGGPGAAGVAATAHELVLPGAATAARHLAAGGSERLTGGSPLAEALAVVLDAMAAAAVRLAVADADAAGPATRGVSLRSSDLAASHELWLRDGARLVTALPPLPVAGGAVNGGKPGVAAPTINANAALDATEFGGDQEAALVACLDAIYRSRDCERPAELSHALSDTARLLFAVEALRRFADSCPPAAARAAARGEARVRRGEAAAAAEVTEDAASEGLALAAVPGTQASAAARGVASLRLVSLLEQRLMQDAMTRSVAAMQNHTAMCKLDVTRGVVGR